MTKNSHYPSNIIAQVICLFLICYCYVHWTWSPILAGSGGDNAIYLLTAKYFSPYSEHSDVAEHFAYASQYPPLFPFLLAIFGGGENLKIAHFVTTLFLLAAFVAYFYFIRSENYGGVGAVACLMVFALMPGSYYQALFVHSENLFLLMSMLSALCISRYENKRVPMFLYLGVLCISMAVIVRSVGIALVIALFAYLFFNKQRKMLWLCIVALLPMFIWKVFGIHTAPSYLDSLVVHYGNHPFEQFFNQVTIELSALWLGWVKNFHSTQFAKFMLGVFAFVCMLGLLFRIYKLKFDGFYVLVYFLIIVIWPYPAEAQRFIFVVTPFLLFQGLCLLDGMPKIVLRKKYVLSYGLMASIGLLVIAMPDLIFTISRYHSPVDENLSDYRHHSQWYFLNKNQAKQAITKVKAQYSSMERISQNITEEDCVYAIKPSVVSFLSNRLSIKAPNFSENVKLEQISNTLRCGYFYMLPFTSPSYSRPFHPWEILSSQLTPIELVRMGDQTDSPIVAILAKHKAFTP